jgi:hypothetical protein
VSTELARTGTAEVSQPQASEVGTLEALIVRGMSDPTFDIGKLERLVAVMERREEQNRQAEFNAAMSRLHARMPSISKEGKIVIAGKEGKAGSVTKFARLEDIDRAIRPLLSEEGLSLSFDTQWLDGRVMVIGKLSHVNGHSETKQIPLPLDVSGSKNNVQGAGSTVSYGRRYLVKMFFNIIEAGEDNDGAGAVKPITQKQADDLQCVMDELGWKPDGEARRKFLQWLKADKLSAISSRDYDKAMNFLQGKKRENGQ